MALNIWKRYAGNDGSCQLKCANDVVPGSVAANQARTSHEGEACHQQPCNNGPEFGQAFQVFIALKLLVRPGQSRHPPWCRH